MIANLHNFDDKLNNWRGGQPDDTGWNYLKSIGITNVVKLDEWQGEGGDEAAEALGMAVQYFPIPFAEQLLLAPSKVNINRAVNNITSNTFVHCVHGEDRTGLVVALWNYRHGMSKESAEQDMLDKGFHKILFGLWSFWKDYK